MLKRTVIKLSGEALGSSSNQSFDDSVIDNIVNQIKKVIKNSTEVALVVGGGNLWRGRSARPDMDKVKADQMGMLATVMNAIYLTEAFKRQGVKSTVMTPIPIGTMTAVYEKDAALDLMAEGTVLINAAGLGHPHFSTDTVTALRAAELEADCILFAKNVDGVYDADPRKNPKAKKYRYLSYTAAISNNLHVVDIAALHLAKNACIPSFLFDLKHPESILLANTYPETESLQGTFLNVDLKEDFYAATK
jgi:uridylate kinase